MISVLLALLIALSTGATPSDVGGGVSGHVTSSDVGGGVSGAPLSPQPADVGGGVSG